MSDHIKPRANATSWLLASEILRRSDGLFLRETHPGGGQYDCLTLHDGVTLVIQINRAGSIHVRGEKIAGFDEWPTLDRSRGVTNAARHILKEAGLPAPQRANATTRTTLTCRVIAEALTLYEPELDARSALYDASGGEGLHVDEASLDIEPLRIAPPEDVWVLRRGEVTTTRLWRGWAYTPRGEHLDLYWRYRHGYTVRRLSKEIVI